VPKLIEYLKNIINSDSFCEKHKQKPQDFTRERSLPFSSLIFLMLNFGNGSYQQELDRYFKILNHWEIAERVVYKSNFTKARSKLKYDAFTELNNSQVQYFYDHFFHQTWHGFNLLAIDGTTVRVPEHSDIMDHFGAWNSAKGRKPCPKARVSQMFDVLNKITIDAVISPKKVGERELANFHFMKLMHDDLVLMDRGYPAYWLFNAIGAMKANFCARVSHKKWKVVKKFYKSGQFESIVKLKSSPISKRKSIEMGLETGPMKVRLIRVPLDTGKTEILMTSLLDKKLYPAEEFKSLYHLRWPVEEDYKTLKYRIQIENFSGKSVHSVYQDFHAKMVSKNLTAIIASTTKEAIAEKSKHLVYSHQLNLAQALAHMKDSIVLLFIRSEKKVKHLVEKIRKLLVQTTEGYRPDRKYPRNHRVKQKRFFLPYKTFC
jgi:hypothetical protein